MRTISRACAARPRQHEVVASARGQLPCRPPAQPKAGASTRSAASSRRRIEARIHGRDPMSSAARRFGPGAAGPDLENAPGSSPSTCPVRRSPSRRLWLRFTKCGLRMRSRDLRQACDRRELVAAGRCSARSGAAAPSPPQAADNPVARGENRPSVSEGPRLKQAAGSRDNRTRHRMGGALLALEGPHVLRVAQVATQTQQDGGGHGQGRQKPPPAATAGRSRAKGRTASTMGMVASKASTIRRATATAKPARAAARAPSSREHELASERSRGCPEPGDRHQQGGGSVARSTRTTVNPQPARSAAIRAWVKARSGTAARHRGSGGEGAAVGA